jgi:hypothetical protein
MLPVVLLHPGNSTAEFVLRSHTHPSLLLLYPTPQCRHHSGINIRGATAEIHEPKNGFRSILSSASDRGGDPLVQPEGDDTPLPAASVAVAGRGRAVRRNALGSNNGSTDGTEPAVEACKKDILGILKRSVAGRVSDADSGRLTG